MISYTQGYYNNLIPILPSDLGETQLQIVSIQSDAQYVYVLSNISPTSSLIRFQYFNQQITNVQKFVIYGGMASLGFSVESVGNDGSIVMVFPNQIINYQFQVNNFLTLREKNTNSLTLPLSGSV